MFFSKLQILFLVSILLPVSIFAHHNSSPLQGIFPPLTPFINYGNLIITYESSGFTLQGNINSGVEATPNDTSIAPSAISITPFGGYGSPFLPINITQLYTLVMIDPDAPSRADPTVAQILHFVQTGLKVTTSLAETTETASLELVATVPPVVPYRGPAPPVDTGLHRYILLLFMQPSDNIDLDSFPADNRRNFDVESFAWNNNFGPPLAGAYFQAQNAENSETSTVPENESTRDEINFDDPAVDGPLVIDTSIPTPPTQRPGDSYPTMTSEIVYEGTLTYSLSPSMTGEVDGDPVTDSVDLSGQIGDWTMTAPGDAGEQVSVTITTEAPVPTSEKVTSSVPALRESSESTTSIAGIQQTGIETPSVSASASASTSVPSWLNNPASDNSAVGKSTGVTMLMGVLAGGTIYLTSIL